MISLMPLIRSAPEMNEDDTKAACIECPDKEQCWTKNKLGVCYDRLERSPEER